MTHHLNTEDEDVFARKSAVRGGEQTRPQRAQERVGEKHSSRRERQSLAQEGTAPRWPEMQRREARA